MTLDTPEELPPVPDISEQSPSDYVNVDTSAPAPTYPGSVFANQQDIERYKQAIANGASPEEALKVGDNGVGAWGDDTTSKTDPIVALSPDTPGFAYNRRVIVTGPKGQVVARIADKGPAGRIDLNPAASAAVGHPGGVVPVTWKYADATGATPATPSSGGIPNIAGRFTPIGSGDPEFSLDELGNQTIGGDSSPSLPSYNGPDSTGETTSPVTVDVPPPSAHGATVVSRDDKSVQLSNGTTFYPATGVMTWQVDGRTFYKAGPNAKTMLMPSGGSKIDTQEVVGDDGKVHKYRMNKDTGERVADLGISPADPTYKAQAEHSPSVFLRKEAAQIGVDTTGMTEGQIAKAMEDKADKEGIILPHLIPAAKSIATMIVNRPLMKDFIKVREAKDIVDTGYENPDDHGFSDMAMIEGFQRVVNPGAIVRVQTMQQMQGAMGYLAKLDPSFQWNHAIEGDKLTPEARNRIKDLADQAYAEKRQRIEPYTKGIKGVAKAYGIKNPDNFIDSTMRMANELSGIEGNSATPQDMQALEWVKNPENQSSPFYSANVATLKAKGLLGADTPTATATPAPSATPSPQADAKQSAKQFLKEHENDPAFKPAIDALKKQGLL